MSISFAATPQSKEAQQARTYTDPSRGAPPSRRSGANASYIDKDHWNKVFTEPEYFDSIAKQKGMAEGAKVSLFGDDYVYRQAMIGYMSATRGVPLDDMRKVFDVEKDAFAQKNLGKKTASAREMFDYQKSKFERDNEKQAAARQILNNVAQRAITDFATGGDTAFVESVAKDIDAAGDMFSDEEKSMLWEKAEENDMKLRATQMRFAPEAKFIFDALRQTTGEGAGFGAPDMRDMAARFAKLPDKQRRAVYELAGSFAQLNQTDKGFWYQMAESLGRGASDIVERVPRNVKEQALRNDLRMLEGDQPVFAGTGVQGTAYSAFGTTPLTPEEREQAADKVRGELGVFKVERELRDLAERVIDPIKTVTVLPEIVEEGLYGAARSLPYTAVAAVPYAGAPAVAGALYSSNYDRIMLEYPDIDPDKAALIAAISAPIEAGLERMKVNTIMGRLPFFGGLVKRFQHPNQRNITRIAIGGAGVLAEQNAQEILQNATFPFVQMIGSVLDKDIPEYNLDLASMPRDLAVQFVALLPLSLMGIGALSHREISRGEAYLRNKDNLGKAGYSEEQIDRITGAATADEAQSILREESKKRDPEKVKAAAQRIVDESIALREKANPAALPRLEKQGADYVVLSPEGKELARSTDQTAAEQALVSARRETVQREMRDVHTGINEAVEFIQKVNEARQRGEDIAEVIREQSPRTLLTDYEANPTQENLDRLYETVRAFGQEINEPAELANFPVIGSNQGALAEGIWRSVIRINEGADGTIVMREFAQDNLKRAISEGRTTMDFVRQQLNDILPQIDSARIERQLRTETDTDVIEAFSDIAVAYFRGSIREEQIPAGLRGIMRRLAIISRDIFRRAYNLARLRAEGKLDRDFEALLAEAVGVNQQALVDRARERTEQDMRGADGLTDEERAALQAELDAEMEQDAAEAVSDGGIDILDAVREAGGLPSTKSSKVYQYAGELKRIREAQKGGNAIGVKGTFNLFRKNAPDLDALIKDLQVMGFGQIETPSDLFDMIERRITTGRPIYGYEARATAAAMENYSIAAGEAQRGADVAITPQTRVASAINGVPRADIFASVKRRFGVTQSLYEAGYVLPDGTMIDFSGRADAGFVQGDDLVFRPRDGERDYMQDQRGTDHREVEWDDMPRYTEIWASMTDFLRLGAIRIDGNSGMISMHSRAQITSSQARVLKDLVVAADGAYVDLEDDLGNKTAMMLDSAKWPRVKGLLERWANGETPAVAQNYSIAITPQQDADYLAAVERGDMETAQRMVDEAARAAGYDIGPVYHGTPDGRFLDVDPVFRSRKDRLGFGFEANVQWFAKDKRTADTYADDRRAFDRQNAEPRTIRTFLQIANPLIVEGGNKGWREAQARDKTGNAITQAISDGHDGIVIRNVKDDYNRMESGQREQTTETYATFSATQIKSADPVTYDASGNVIPFSQRFDATTADINYSIVRSKNSLRVRMTRQAMTDAALAQESWKDWYEEHQAVLDEFFGDHAQLFQDILSITSQAASVKANVGLALRAFGLYVRGEPFDGMLRGQEKRGFLPAVIKNLERHRENDQLQGQKIRAYKASNDGEVDQAVVDRHIAQLIFGVKSPSKAQFAKAQKILSEIANEIGWTPRQVQAALWAHSIYKSGKTPQSYGDYLKQLESRGTIEQRIGDLGRRGPSGDADGGRRGRYAPDGAAEGAGVSNYSISTQSEIDRVQKAMGALDRSPLSRIKIYEKMQERFLRVMSDNRETLAAMEGDLSQVRRTQILQALGELDGIISALPAEIRAKIGGYTQLAKVDPMDVFKGDQKVSEVRGMSGAIISAWMREGLNIGEAQKKTELPAGYRAERNLDPTRADRAIADVFIQRINRINEALEKFLRDEYNDAAVELFKRAKPQRSGAGEKPKGKLGADVHALFDKLKEATEWSAEEAQAWADGQWARIEAGELNPYEEAHATLAAQVLPLFADWANADSTQRAAAVTMGKDILDRAYKGEQQRIIAQRTKRGYDRTDLSKDAGVSAEDDKARQNAVKRENSLPSKWEAAMLNLLNFDQVLRYVFGNDSKIARQISDRQRKADNAKSDDVAALSDDWATFLSKLGGGEMQGQQLLFDLSRMDEEIDGVAYSQNQLVAITMMWMQPKGRQHMEGFFDSDGQPSGKWHYNQGFVNKAEALLTEESKAIREYLLRKYDEEYDALNKVYRKVYGLNLPKNQFYSPLSVEPIKAPQGASIDPVTGAVFAAGANSPSALRSRGGAIAQPVFRDAVQTYFGHMLQMAHWKAYAEFNSEVSALLGHRDTRNVVKGKAGEQAATVMNNWLQYFQQGGNKDAANHLAINQWINRITGNFAAISLFGRVSTLALQVTQLGAASAKMPVGAYLSRFGKLMSGRLGWTTALDSDYIQRRIKDMPPAVALAMQGLRAEKPSQIRNAARWLGQHLSGFDGFFTAGTYAIVYDYQLSQARQNGMGGQEAADYAREATERIVDEIAQPTRAGARSIYELNSTNPVARAVWAFSSESRKNMGLLMFNGAKGGSRNFGKALTYVLLLNGLVGIVIRNAFRDMRDDDDDEVFDEKNWGWKRLAAQFISDPIYGIPVVGETIEGGIYTAFGVYKPSGSVFDVARGVPAAARMVTQYPAQVLEGEAEFRDIVADVNRVLAAAGLFNSNIAGAAAISNLAKDVFEVTDNALGDE